MCKSFEIITGKKNIGNVGKLEGLCKMYLDMGLTRAIIRIPVEMMEIDTRYQTEVRTERDLQYLVNNWDERKLLPLIVVPHWKEGKLYIVDGYGRWVASQIVDPVKYADLECMVLLDAPIDENERLSYEANLYAFQNKQVAKMTPIQRHGAMMCLQNSAAMALENLKEKYAFEFVSKPGKRDISILGSYTETLELCKLDNGKAANYVFGILVKAGFDRKVNGYSRYMLRGLRDIYKLYANDREETFEYFINAFRGQEPLYIKSAAVTKYPMLEVPTAVSLYLEDRVVEDLNLVQSRKTKGNRIVSIDKIA